MLKRTASNVFWLSILLGIPYYFWLWSIGTKLQTKNTEVNEIQLVLFKVSILYPLAYFVFAIYYLFTNGWFVMPLHLAAMFSTLYTMMFAAKTLKSVELDRRAKVSDFLGDFFLVWFFPIGIWILQPRIHKLVKK